jgi:hypothetical protein
MIIWENGIIELSQSENLKLFSSYSLTNLNKNGKKEKRKGSISKAE